MTTSYFEFNTSSGKRLEFEVLPSGKILKNICYGKETNPGVGDNPRRGYHTPDRPNLRDLDTVFIKQ